MLLVAVTLTFLLTTFGLGWPFASRLKLDPAEQLGATVVLSLLGAYLLTFAIYLAGLPVLAVWALPFLGAGGLLAGRRALPALFADAAARAMLAGLGLVTAWCVGWLALVASYSGGGWAADWYEHWERTQFFLSHWPLDTKFLGIAPLPARPPLANLATAGLVGVAGINFPTYQAAMTLLNCLVFVPAALLARRFRGPAGAAAVIALLAVLLMLNPSFVENATFAWTKLVAAALVLTGLYFFLRAQDPAAPAAAGPLGAASLAAGFLAHYSAGPYLVMLALAWGWRGKTRLTDPAWWRQTLQLAAIGAAVLATWFGWSIAAYGPAATFLSNTSVTEVEHGNQFVKIALNLRDTFIPHCLRLVDGTMIAQRSRWGYWRDWTFQLYQVNLLLMFGSAGWLGLARGLAAGAARADAATRRFWAAFAVGTIFLGVAVHGARDHWGLGHICLQALVVLGLAALAARWTDLGKAWRVLLVAGAGVDLVLGIALNFGVQGYLLDRWLAAGRPSQELLQSYSDSAFMNLAGKITHRLVFLADVLPVTPALVLGALAVILAVALARAARAARRAD
ncbi:MAG: hypothetical protein JSR48_12965 [Verrucomicrobia bacterium]|nr:hypothetical protein [Verrucomicrobiota bacterium]